MALGVTIVIIERECREWPRAWERLAALPINRGLEQPTVAENGCEMWEYMDTYWEERDARWVHEFRHRNHPVAKDRLCIQIKATGGWQPDDDGLEVRRW